MLHAHVLLVAPLGASYVPQFGTDQHEGGVAVRETAHYSGFAGGFRPAGGADQVEANADSRAIPEGGYLSKHLFAP